MDVADGLRRSAEYVGPLNVTSAVVPLPRAAPLETQEYFVQQKHFLLGSPSMSCVFG